MAGSRPHALLLTAEPTTQVLEDSLQVLAEVEALICACMNLPPGSRLEDQGPDALARVPKPLLDTLEVQLMQGLGWKGQLWASSKEKKQRRPVLVCSPPWG